MRVSFTTETIAGVVATHPVYDVETGRLAGLIEGPASSGRKTWRAIFQGSRVGDFKTAELAKAAVEQEAGK